MNKYKNTVYFFGWTNIKWVIRELIKIYSPNKSFFSKKRIESNFAFFIGQLLIILYFNYHYRTMSMSDFLLLISVEFVISGYYVTQIQREKRNKKIDNTETNIDNENDDLNEHS